jgi:hypothetical protein
VRGEEVAPTQVETTEDAIYVFETEKKKRGGSSAEGFLISVCSLTHRRCEGPRGVEVSGFVDVLGKVFQAADSEWSTSVQVGAHEVDFASELSDR